MSSSKNCTGLSMTSSLGPTQAAPLAGLDLELDAYVEAFEAAAYDGVADLSDFLPPPSHPKYLAVLAELIRADLEFAWERGDERRLEGYRERFPTLFNNPATTRDLIAEELRLRRNAGEEPDPAEYRVRFGFDLSGSLDHRQAATQVLSPSLSAEWCHERIPAVGDTIPPGLVLEAELGVGTFGRVYRARQADLAGRPVAVKLSARLVGESQMLARLQHTNIVPIYSFHRVGQFTALVMPYLGRTTLADLIETFRRSGDRPGSGRALVSTLASRADRTVPGSIAGPASQGITTVIPSVPQATLERFSRYSFVESVLWIGAELADGLAHAHERGILHRDIKPANILFTDDGRPMLLDFNLAADLETPTGASDGMGGTLRYMAPEQLAALRHRQGEVTAQADVYSLGLVLFELLAGRLPFEDAHGSLNDVLDQLAAQRRLPLNLARLPPEVTPAVTSILKRCLAPQPAERYASAADLRTDLQRQLANQPLAIASDPSPRERLRKWTRRHPRLSSTASSASLAGLLLLLVVGAFLFRQRHLERLEAEQARTDLRQAVGIVYAGDGPAAEAHDMRATLLQALAPFHVESAGWLDQPVVRRLSASDRTLVRQDAILAMKFAEQLTTRLAENASDATQRTAFQEEARSWHTRFLREVEAGLDQSVQTAVREGRLPEKAAELRQLVRNGEPRYATWMTLGTVEARLERPAAAIEAFSAALGLNPQLPWPYLHRGIARLDLQAYHAAQEDFDRFLEMKPAAADGHFNRALARLSLGDLRGAHADLDEAERRGFRVNRLYVLRARAKRQLGDQAGADRDQQKALLIEPMDPRGWAVRGELKLAMRPADPVGALADFEAALRQDADFLPALRDKASVLSENLNRPADAVVVLDQILDLVPHATADRAGRAVVLARLGRKADAQRDAVACVNSDHPLTLYQAACALLLHADSPTEKTRGLGLLRSALRRDPTWAKTMTHDPDLKGVQTDPAFRELIASAEVLARSD